MDAVVPVTETSSAAPHKGQRRRHATQAPNVRLPRKALHGVLLLDKPLGWTSNDALQKAKGILRAEKAGHTGTLDPLANGLLPLCLGAATKFSQVSLDADKCYRATLRLGQRTRTGDGEGEIELERPVQTNAEAIAQACIRLTGAIEQLPPMHSALKHQGRALYTYARAGVEVEREPRSITVHEITIASWQGERLVLDVNCSKGTYIRTLAQDLGELLGCGAHLSALQRTACGPLKLAQAISLDDLAMLSEAEREARLLPVDALLAGWPHVQLPHDDAGRFLCGLRRRVNAADQAHVRVYGPAASPHERAFLGTAHIAGGELIADRLLSPSEVRASPALPLTNP